VLKIILSRKGFDSVAGEIASPIMPDGTLLYMPIPFADGVTYGNLYYNNVVLFKNIRGFRVQRQQ
jgi:hypothetical protein